MIKVDGQYQFAFSIAGQVDFIAEDAFEEFTIIEEAGSGLPTFVLIFKTSDEREIPYLNEGNEFVVSYGKDESNLSKTTLRIGRMDSAKEGVNLRRIILTGTYSALGYVNTSVLKITEKITSEQAIKTEVSNFFKVDSKVSTKDKQRWISPNISCKRWVNEMWLHSHVEGSVMLLGITAEGSFRMRSLADLSKSEPAWRFTHSVENVIKDIPFLGEPQTEVSSALTNSWFAYGRESRLMNHDSGSQVMVRGEPSTFLSTSGTLNKNPGLGLRYSDVGFVSENVHENYAEAYLKNMAFLAAFSAVKTRMSFMNTFYQVRVLDLVLLLEIAADQQVEASESFSGRFIVTKVVVTLKGKILTSSVEMCREGINVLKGI